MRRILATALFAVALLVLTSCSSDTTSRSEPSKNTSSGGASDGGSETTSSTAEATLSPTDGETTRDDFPEGTLKEKPDKPEVVLRLEGSPKIAFRGICTVGDRDEVLSGKVPQRFTFDLEGRELDCRIQKRNPGGGSLRVILLDGDRTRSVQSTQSSGGTITLSYSPG